MGDCLPVILDLSLGGALVDLVAAAFAAAFFEIPYSAAFLAMLEVGSDPGLRPGDLLNP